MKTKELFLFAVFFIILWISIDGAFSKSPEVLSYSGLFAAIGTPHSAPDENSFNLPDYRGRFLRGVDGSDGSAADRDPDSGNRTAAAPGGNEEGIGTVQEDEFKSHAHDRLYAGASRQGSLLGSGGAPCLVTRGEGNNKTGGNSTQTAGGSETRPENAYVNYIIKL